MQKHLLYKQFLAWSCDGCSITPSTDYIHNPVYQELIEETDYFGNKSDERIYLDLRASASYTNKMEKLERNNYKITLYITLKSAATKTLRLRIWGYSLGKYVYVLARDRLTLRHKTYIITQEDSNFLERKNNQLKEDFGI